MSNASDSLTKRPFLVGAPKPVDEAASTEGEGDAPGSPGSPSQPPPAKPPSTPPPSRPRKPTDVLVNHPDVVKVIHAVLREKGIKNTESLRDLTAVVQSKALAAPGGTPDTLDGWKPRVRAIAITTTIDEMRREIAQGRTNAGATPDADEVADPKTERRAMDPADRAKVRESVIEIADALPDGDKILTLAQKKAFGLTNAEAARDEGVPEWAISRRWNTFVKIAKDHPVLCFLAAAGVAWGVVVALPEFRGGPVAKDNHTPEAQTPEVLVDAPWEQDRYEALAREKHEKAAATLLRAEIAYSRMEWHKCVQLVDEAAKIDPTVGASPELRHVCDQREDWDSNSKHR